MLHWNALKRPIIALSPMADMTDSAFCRTVKSIASPVLFREMISSEAIVRGNEKTFAMAEFVEPERPIVQQFFGSDPKTMAEAVQKIERLYHPDGIDINMGCPVYKITSNFNGAALMKEPERAMDIVRAIKERAEAPVSIKIRLGWKKNTDALTFAKQLEEAGADLLTVHGRTKEQGYSGKSDWNMIAEVKKRVSIPVLCNGDIFTPEDAKRALEISGCDGVLIARGALGNPWIFSRIAELLQTGIAPPPPALEERVRVIKEHLALHTAQYGERGVVTFRKHLSWYLKGLPCVKTYREEMHTFTTSAHLLHALDDLLTKSR